MKKILLAGILILLLLVGTAAAVSVSYAQSQEISLSTARDNANSALISFVAQGKLGSSAAMWKGATLSQSPITIYDQSGVVYSYLFDVVNKDGTIVGQVNAAGNKLVGMPVISIEKSARSFDPDLIIPKVSELAATAYGGSKIDYVVFYIGLDQKIGVMAILTEKNGLNHRMTFDLQTFKLKSDLLSHPGLIDASTPSSIFVSMSSSAANIAIRNYDSKTKIVARGVPSMRRVIPVNYLNSTGTRFPGVSVIKSGEKDIMLSDYKSALIQQGQILPYMTVQSTNNPMVKAPVSSSIIGQLPSASRFFPV